MDRLFQRTQRRNRNYNSTLTTYGPMIILEKELEQLKLNEQEKEERLKISRRRKS